MFRVGALNRTSSFNCGARLENVCRSRGKRYSSELLWWEPDCCAPAVSGWFWPPDRTKVRRLRTNLRKDRDARSARATVTIGAFAACVNTPTRALEHAKANSVLRFSFCFRRSYAISQWHGTASSYSETVGTAVTVPWGSQCVVMTLWCANVDVLMRKLM